MIPHNCPYYFSCGNTYPSLGLHEWVHQAVVSQFGLPPSAIEYWLNRGNIVLLLDGLDESQSQEGVANRITEFASLHRDISIAVSARLHVGAVHQLAEFTSFELLPLSMSDIASMLRLVEPRSIELLRRIMEREDLEEVVRRPRGLMTLLRRWSVRDVGELIWESPPSERELVSDLRQRLARLKLEPESATAPDVPDISWQVGDKLWIAEAKTLGRAEDSDLDSSLRQMLHYMRDLGQRGRIAGLVVIDRAPSSPLWIERFDSAGVVLAWPDVLDEVMRTRVM